MTLTKRRTELHRLTLFSVVGAVNTAVCYALFALLVHVCAWNYHLALGADYGFGIVLGYLLHRVSTFADRKHVRQAFGKYTVTLLVTFLANLALLDALVRGQWLGPLAGQAVATMAVTLLSYLAQKHWVFRSHAQATPAPLDQSGAAPPNVRDLGRQLEPAARRAA